MSALGLWKLTCRGGFRRGRDDLLGNPVLQLLGALLNFVFHQDKRPRLHWLAHVGLHGRDRLLRLLPVVKR